MLDLLFYLVAVIAVGFLYRENIQYKKRVETLEKELKEEESKLNTLKKEYDKLVEVDQKQRYDIKNLKAFKTEAARLRLLLKKLKEAYESGKVCQTQNTPNTSEQHFKEVFSDEIHLLKEQEAILKEEEALLLEDNKLLKENNEILNKEITNLKKQISELRESNSKIPSYLETITKQTNELEVLMKQLKHQ